MRLRVCCVQGSLFEESFQNLTNYIDLSHLRFVMRISGSTYCRALAAQPSLLRCRCLCAQPDSTNRKHNFGWAVFHGLICAQFRSSLELVNQQLCASVVFLETLQSENVVSDQSIQFCSLAPLPLLCEIFAEPVFHDWPSYWFISCTVCPT